MAVVHPWVHAVALFKIKQRLREPIRQFGSWVRAIARNCNMKQRCGSLTCAQSNLFEEAITLYAMLAGLEDMELRNQVITRENLEKTVDLAKWEVHYAAYESARRNQVGQVEDLGASKY